MLSNRTLPVVIQMLSVGIQLDSWSLLKWLLCIAQTQWLNQWLAQWDSKFEPPSPMEGKLNVGLGKFLRRQNVHSKSWYRVKPVHWCPTAQSQQTWAHYFSFPVGAGLSWSQWDRTSKKQVIAKNTKAPVLKNYLRLQSLHSSMVEKSLCYHNQSHILSYLPLWSKEKSCCSIYC